MLQLYEDNYPESQSDSEQSSRTIDFKRRVAKEEVRFEPCSRVRAFTRVIARMFARIYWQH